MFAHRLFFFAYTDPTVIWSRPYSDLRLIYRQSTPDSTKADPAESGPEIYRDHPRDYLYYVTVD